MTGMWKTVDESPPTERLLRRFPKESWYRVKEREHTKTPISRATVGTTVPTKRIIVRTGYYTSPTELYGEELANAVIRYIMRQDVSMEDTMKVICALFGDPNYMETDYPWPWKRMENVYRIVRGSWVRNFPRGDRTFWYVDIPEQSFIIKKVVYRKNGRPVPESGSASDWSEDYDPPYLDEWVTQGLYAIQAYENSNKEFYIHPLDVNA